MDKPTNTLRFLNFKKIAWIALGCAGLVCVLGTSASYAMGWFGNSLSDLEENDSVLGEVEVFLEDEVSDESKDEAVDLSEDSLYGDLDSDNATESEEVFQDSFSGEVAGLDAEAYTSTDSQEMLDEPSSSSDSELGSDASFLEVDSGSSSDSLSSDLSSASSGSSSGSNALSSSTSTSGSSSNSTSSSSSSASSNSSSSSSASFEPDSSTGSVEPDTITVSVSIDSSRVVSYGYESSLGSAAVTLPEGSSVYDALCALGVSVGGSSGYVSSIGGLSEFDCGSGSGWMYFVDGSYSSYSCGSYVLQGGESITWIYTCDRGNDI